MKDNFLVSLEKLKKKKGEVADVVSQFLFSLSARYFTGLIWIEREAKEVNNLELMKVDKVIRI